MINFGSKHCLVYICLIQINGIQLSIVKFRCTHVTCICLLPCWWICHNLFLWIIWHLSVDTLINDFLSFRFYRFLLLTEFSWLAFVNNFLSFRHLFFLNYIINTCWWNWITENIWMIKLGWNGAIKWTQFLFLTRRFLWLWRIDILQLDFRTDRHFTSIVNHL